MGRGKFVVATSVGIICLVSGWVAHSLVLKQKEPKEVVEKKEQLTLSSDEDLIKSILAQELGQRTFSFDEVVFNATGKRVIPFNREVHAEIANAILVASKKSLEKFNALDSPLKNMRRINEASKYFEDYLCEELDLNPHISCEIPKNQRGVAQRSGYPDLLITHIATDIRVYLDPKLYEKKSKTSSLRTFYYGPKKATNKIQYDAIHLLLGIQHDGNDGNWKFEEVNLVDLSTVQVNLKAEFQTSNKVLYTSESIIQ